MIEIKYNFKSNGKDTQLWYYGMEGKQFDLCLDTKKGYLVKRTDIEDSRMYLIKHKHGVFVEPEDLDCGLENLDDEMV